VYPCSIVLEALTCVQGVVGIFQLLQVQDVSTSDGKETLQATYEALFDAFLKAVTPA
jgi:hypothetical protein